MLLIALTGLLAVIFPVFGQSSTSTSLPEPAPTAGPSKATGRLPALGYAYIS